MLAHSGTKLSLMCLKRVAHVRHLRLTAFYPDVRDW
jgi:hypothetical protein